MRKSLLVGLAVAAPILFASGASACGWGCDCAPSYGYSYGYSAPRVYGYSSYGYASYDTAATTVRRTATAATTVGRTDTAATTVQACASMVRGRTVGVAEWASVEWDGAEDAAGSHELSRDPCR